MSAKKNNILVIQPHGDDMALSCGGTISRSRFGQEQNIVCLTVFSSYSAKFCSPGGGKNRHTDVSFTEMRNEEDKDAVDYLGGKIEFLNEKEAPARDRNDIVLRDGKFTDEDIKLIERTSEKIRSHIEKYNPRRVFFPSAIGWHVDHVIVHEAVAGILRDRAGIEFVMYEDFPYCNSGRYTYWKRISDLSDRFKACPDYTDITDFADDKAELIFRYRSQFSDWGLPVIRKVVEETGISTAIEARYLNHLKKGDNRIFERNWKL